MFTRTGSVWFYRKFIIYAKMLIKFRFFPNQNIFEKHLEFRKTKYCSNALCLYAIRWNNPCVGFYDKIMYLFIYNQQVCKYFYRNSFFHMHECVFKQKQSFASLPPCHSNSSNCSLTIYLYNTLYYIIHASFLYKYRNI